MEKIVHLSNTPLVGAPGKLSALCNDYGYESFSIVLSDYPEKGQLNNKFMKNSILWDKQDPFIMDLVLFHIKTAKIVHIHNDINLDFFNKIDWSPKQKFIYHVHSPLREGPIYFDKTSSFNVEFSKKLVVGQYHTRHYPDFTPVPNIVLAKPSNKLIQDDEKLKIMFSPTHNRGGRWNNKHSQQLTDAITSLQKMKKVDVITPLKPLSQDVLLELRKLCHISIDEISTGAYHQVSLEGLCAGNVVINNADFFSAFNLSNMVGAKELPPFYKCSPENISDKLIELISNYDLVRDYQRKSFDFFRSYLMPDNLFLQYNLIYEEVLNAT